MSKKRIIQLDGTTSITSNDYLGIDSSADGTRKIDFDSFKAAVNNGQATDTDLATAVANFAAPYDSTASYAVGDYCIKDLVLYKCISPTSGTWDSSKWTQVTALDLTSGVASDLADEIEARQSADETLQGEIDELPVDVKVDGVSVVDTNNVAQINNKANTTGTYDDLVVGTAQNLLSESFTEDKVPYNFRQSFNGARLEDEIVGGTVAWNQLAKELNSTNWGAVSATVTYSNGEATLTSSSNSSVAKYLTPFSQTTLNHVYYVYGKGKSDGTAEVSIGVWQANGGDYSGATGTGWVTSTSYTNIYEIAKTTAETSIIGARLRNAVPSGNYGVFKDINIIDLTQMFGSTIADYIYSLEQATAGAGVAYFRNLFPKSYYAYNAGALMSVNASSHDTVGKNLFDNVWSDYTQPSDYRICPIRLEQGKTYTISATKLDTVTGCTVAFVKRGNQYSEFGSFDTIVNSSGVVSSYIPKTFTVDASYESPKLAIYCPNEDVFNSIFDNYEIQLEEGSTATTYEPYTKHTYPLDSDLTLRGIPKLDSNNNLYYDGDIYASDGSVTRRFGVVDLGTLSWTYYSGAFYTTITGIKHGTGFKELLTIKYVTDNAVSSMGDVSNWSDKTIRGNSASAEYIYIKDSAYSDAPTFKTAMNGVYLVYELATPTSETADAFINPQIVDARGTEEYVDYAESQGTRDVAIPVGHNSKYYADLKSKIENIPDVPSTNGTYTLKATRSASGVTYAWVSG